MSATLVVRRATFSRLGALSGKIIVIFSSTASGISRLVSRDTRMLTRIAAPRMTTTASHPR